MSVNGLAAPVAELEEGATFTSRGRTITESDLVSFSALTGDWHPQHADAAWAATSRFGERVAHGMMVLSYAVGLVGFDPERVVALRGLDGVVFKRPVRVGDTIRVEGTVEGVRPLDDDLALCDLDWRIRSQDDVTVARAKVTAVWRRRATERAEPDRPEERADEKVFSELYL
jgi:3-hydroxybutyryl-CoA dehydratase